MAKPESLNRILDRIENAGAVGGRVKLGGNLDAVGRRSFGPLLLVAGLVTLAPVIGDIPGMPTLMAILVFLVGVQLLLRRDQFWLPHFLINRTVPDDKLKEAIGWMRRPAKFIDRWTGPRIGFLVQDTGIRFIAVACILLALAMPAMEMIPFSANLAGAALTIFGLGMIARDGLLSLIGLAFSTATFGLVASLLI